MYNFNKVLTRPVALLIALIFLWLAINPTAYAEGFKKPAPVKPNIQQPKTITTTPAEKLEKTLTKLEELTDKADVQAIGNSQKDVEDINKQVEDEFTKTEKFLKDKKISPKILDRHYKFVKEYKEKYNTLKSHITDIKAGKKEKIKELKTFLKKNKAPKRESKIDPDNLPHRSAEPTKKKPAKKTSVIPAFAQEKNSRYAGKFNVQVASNNPKLAMLSAQSTADDLAGTIDVQITDEIKSIAQFDKKRDPIKIYEWVKNNITYEPTYGSIKGAKLTLWEKSGNAFDIASLLIALLRAAGYPARYVYGSIDVQGEYARNWLGGVETNAIAANVAASGGIPAEYNAAVVELEHVWVEAYIPYGFGMGANRNEKKMWVPMDASFKQYAYHEPLDVKSITGFDPQSFVNQLQTSATIDQTTGSVTNVNPTLIQNQLTSIETSLKNYISTNIPNAKTIDIVGGKKIIQENLGVLPPSLPYKVLALTGEYDNLPDILRSKLNINIKDKYGISNLISITKNLPELAGKRITISYAPATSDDEALINQSVQAQSTTLLAYLIDLKPEIKIEGSSVAISNQTIGMGFDHTVNLTFALADGTSEFITHDITAGSYAASGLNLGKISESYIIDRVANLQIDLEKYPSTKDDTIGEMLHQVMLSYWFGLDNHSEIIARMQGIVTDRLPSEGLATYNLQSDTIFGVPSSAQYIGKGLDVKLDLTIGIPKNGNKEKRKSYFIETGYFSSAMESSVLDLLFGQAGKAISAVKILEIANKQGIPIYQINTSNINTILPLLQIDEAVKLNITNLVRTGKIVTIPKQNISHEGWTGAGYIVINPNTGYGVYMIANTMGGALIEPTGAALEETLPNTPIMIGLYSSLGYQTVTLAGGEVGLVSAEAMAFAVSPAIIIDAVIIALIAIIVIFWTLCRCECDFTFGYNNITHIGTYPIKMTSLSALGCIWARAFAFAKAKIEFEKMLATLYPGMQFTTTTVSEDCECKNPITGQPG